MDGNAHRMRELELAQCVRESHIRPIGIGAMNRMAVKANTT